MALTPLRAAQLMALLFLDNEIDEFDEGDARDDDDDGGDDASDDDDDGGDDDDDELKPAWIAAATPININISKRVAE